MTGTTGSDDSGSGASGSGTGGAAGEVQWYIARDGQQHGPLSDTEIHLFVDGGHLRPTDLLWRPGFTDWRPALQVFPPRTAALPLPPLPPIANAQPRPAETVTAELRPQEPKPTDPRPAQPQPTISPAAATPTAALPPSNNAPGNAAGPAASSAAPGAARAAPGPAMRQPYGQPQPDPRALPDSRAMPDPRTQPRAQSQTDMGQRTDPGNRGGPHYGARPGETTARTQPATGGGPAGGQSRPAGNPTAGMGAPTGTAVTRTRSNSSRPRDEPRRSRGLTVALALLLVAAIASSVWYIVVNKADLMRMAGIGTKAVQGKVPVVKAEPAVTAALQKPKPFLAPAPAAAVVVDTSVIDGVLQRRPLWNYMKTSFPDWYGDQIKVAARLAAEKKPDREVTRHLVDALVAYRRKNADQALKAGTGRHRAIAVAFLDNLQALAARSGDTCYRFISQGETSPVVVDLIHDVATAGPIETQALRIFEAVVEGKAQPVNHDRPKKEDYDLLAAQLGKLGWSQADLQMFADPKALSGAPPARVCQMVRDWFKAHVDIPDAVVQQRLLFETLRPVVAG